MKLFDLIHLRDRSMKNSIMILLDSIPESRLPADVRNEIRDKLDDAFGDAHMHWIGKHFVTLFEHPRAVEVLKELQNWELGK